MKIPKTSYQKPVSEFGVQKGILHLDLNQNITYQHLVQSLSNALHQDLPLQK